LIEVQTGILGKSGKTVLIGLPGNIADFGCGCCSPTSDGAACVIVASKDFVRRHNLEPQAIEIIAQAMYTDFPSTFTENSCMKMVQFRFYCWWLFDTFYVRDYLH